jgi:hypothetical protein
MSEQINDGGPAFPNVPSDPGYTKWDEGMSLRDWFAGQALAGMAASRFWAENVQANRPGCLKLVAQSAYDMADAMLKARGGGK